MNADEDFNKWLDSLTHLKDKVILPDYHTVLKTRWVKPDGFDSKGFNEFLKGLYNDKYKGNDK